MPDGIDLSEMEKSAIEDALRLACTRLPACAQKYNIDLRTARENHITVLLREELDRIRRDPSVPVLGFSQGEFQHMPVSENLSDCSGHPADQHQKQPDLVFRPVYTPSAFPQASMYYGVFVECKLIDDPKNKHDINHYCKAGLMRFLDGRYAWAMPSGLMVAYVRNQKKISTYLSSHLKTYRTQYRVQKLPKQSIRTGRPPATPPIYISTHERYCEPNGKPLSPINIGHLWLSIR
jgi:hypothetical protein